MPKPPYPCLWFDRDAQEAAAFYTTIFPNSAVDKVSRAAADYPSGKAGDILTVDFTLDGQRFTGLNGGPEFKANEAISFYVDCESQDEVDRLWEALTADGGEEGQCGWAKDRYGVWWQIIPRTLPELLQSDDPDRAARVMQAMLQMRKIDVATLQNA